LTSMVGDINLSETTTKVASFEAFNCVWKRLTGPRDMAGLDQQGNGVLGMNLKGETAVVCGAGGFIGGHLVKGLIANGVNVVRAVDVKPLEDWYQVTEGVESLSLDLKDKESCMKAADGVSLVYQLAADMGGMGFIENNKALCMLSVLTNTHMLVAAQAKGVKRFFYSSSACVYNGEKQTSPDVIPLKEEDAYPALPEDGYGWEKLFSERMCRHFEEDYGLVCRVARYHNVYGPEGTWNGGREKAPAAMCRKVIEAKLSGNHEINIWGDGKQTRSFMYIDDCVKGSQMIMESEIDEPINLGSSELVTINQLVDIVEDIAGIKLKRTYDLSAPKGVNGRNSDNSMILDRLSWEPSIRLRDGMEKTYRWIEHEIATGAKGK
jgi:GDP-D-mannose 3',5'-epimerase